MTGLERVADFGLDAAAESFRVRESAEEEAAGE